MEKKFNITGTCIPDKHYMVDTSNKIDKIIKLIEAEEYFIINRPRQYGKTTTLYLLEKKLNNIEGYLPIKISFEAIDTESYSEVQKFINSIMIQIRNYFRFSSNKEVYKFIINQYNKINTMNEFSGFITDLVEFTEKKVILIIDEVDKSSNNQLFLDFLGILRSKYLLRNEGKDYTFNSVVLAGVHDVKTLKFKIRQDEEHKYNSPWNIASDFDVDMSFSIEEIRTMLDDYTENKEMILDKAYFSERLYFYTSGYPFLVSKLCKIIDEKIMIKNELKWEKEYIDMAVKELLKESNTNFDSLIKNIENDIELYEFIKKLVLEDEEIAYIKTDEIINKGSIYGILKEDNGFCKINNKIYEQLIYNHMMMKVIRKSSYSAMSEYNYKLNFIKSNGDLDINKILIKFQGFMKHEYSEKRESFLEDDGRLVFLAFISPIINGTGFAFKEVQGGEEKRFDIVITYNRKMYILELKKWNGEEYHKKGLLQLAEYLEQYSLENGYLLIFDFRRLRGEVGKVEENTVIFNGKEKKIIEAYC
ncbi:AAA family ATPase [Clostridium beijerinckii]|uniref:AAA family ATPase n=1 Tax=Clostridium beijerinckii TaxID=1520 RepID=UPI0013617FD5|nr:AAA family ATPase [Clostridium beijerinckii]MZK49866.1 AAA family ATPase [Clostridium beijerinckii]MZK57825.1 AAA family ATPase [Clostridium beijerinckii]MZK68036.1 AAA family ATPase [Clostridium beijerinckii]MZK73533.1 AAA family ATPase [Clostridium beijerinckii]MZK83116.1 AAA family ATPase [Clostridium beijerinckii]